MRSARWISPWKNSREKPSIYHCISRVVDRRFALEEAEREQFRMFMRMQENFSGCRILSYCLMSNHFHILLEVPPMAEGGLSDAELLRRISCANSGNFVATVRQELQRARAEGNEAWAAQIHARFTYRMHDLSEFMKTLLQRFTRWFNRTHDRSGTLWEARYKSVLVESGIAARTIAAYIDLNPVRAGMVSDPASYRWSSYGEAIGGGRKGNGKKAREGLVRACMSHEGAGFESERWAEVSKIYRSALGLALGRKSGRALVDKSLENTNLNTEEALALGAGRNGTVLGELGMAAMLLCRIRYFTDGAVIGSKSFVNEAFEASREQFSEGRKSGARQMRGNGSSAAGILWSLRDLRVDIGNEA